MIQNKSIMSTSCDPVLLIVLLSRFRSANIYLQLQLRQMQLKIRFGTTNATSECRALPLNCLAMAAVAFVIYFLGGFNKCPPSFTTVERSNTTLSAKEVFLCANFLSKCSCPPALNISVDLTNCTTDRERTYSRILFLTSFVLQVIVIGDLFTLHGDYSRQIVKSMRIAALITFVGLTITIWRNECYLRYMIFILHTTACTLCLFSCQSIMFPKRHQSVSHNADIYENTNRTRRGGNRGNAWRELL